MLWALWAIGSASCRTQAANPKASHSSESNIRVTSRVGRILAEFGGLDDWCSVTVMRHSLATVLQVRFAATTERRGCRSDRS